MNARAVQRETIAALGSELSQQMLEAVLQLYDTEQRSIASRLPATAKDVPYGAHGRHRLDVYAPTGCDRLAPVLIWVHGGGFIRGDKGDDDYGRWENANAGRAAAQRGLLGVVMNYRLAPQHPWPAGSEDVAAVVDWVKQHAQQYGGDPSSIVLMGTSAGAVHVAGYLKLRPQHTTEVCGAGFLSGQFGLTASDDMRDRAYYGEDADQHASRIPLTAVVDTELPLFVACAEFDPIRFQTEFVGLLQRRLQRHGRLPRSYMASGHNHFSLAFHLGGSDERVIEEIRSFVHTCTDHER